MKLFIKTLASLILFSGLIGSVAFAGGKVNQTDLDDYGAGSGTDINGGGAVIDTGAGAPGGGGTSNPNANTNTVPAPQGTTAPPNTARTSNPINVDACSQAFSEANECCNNPLACLGAKGNSGQDIASAMQIIGSLASMGMGNMNAEDAAKMKQACQIMQIVGAAAAGVNGGGAAICNQKKNSCLSACRQVKKEVAARATASSPYCNSLDPDVAASVPECSGGGDSEAKLMEAENYANSRIHSCETFTANVQAMGQQAVQSGSAASMGQLCAQMASSTTPTGFEVGQVDCSMAANQNDPRCRDCSDPQNANNPICKQVDTGDGSTTNVGSTAGLGKTTSSSFDSSGLEGNETQGPQFQALGANGSSKSSGIPGNSGGFSGGGNSGPGGGGAGGGAGGGGYNTDVLKGLGGGGGYSGDPGGGYVSSSGGFSGYGGSGRSPGSSFDLRAFLPGGQKDPNRKVAGVGSVRPEIGASHEDIFDRLSKRVKEICKLNRLYDCGK